MQTFEWFKLLKLFKDFQVLQRFELSRLRLKSHPRLANHLLKPKPSLYLALEMSVVNIVYIAAFLGTKITHCVLPVKEAAANQSHILWKIFHQNFIGCDVR